MPTRAARPILRLVHHMARSGGTLISKCLGCMSGVLLLSEPNPAKRALATSRKYDGIASALQGADAFVGLSVGGVVSAEELLRRGWDDNADPFTNAVRITVSALRKRLGEPAIIATVPGVGYRIDADAGPAA